MNMTHVRCLDADFKGKYDVMICACGYESRSRFVPQKIALRTTQRAAIGFDYHPVGSFATNVDWFIANGFFDWNGGEFIGVSDSDFPVTLQSIIAQLKFENMAKVAVDISSFSLIRLAHIVDFLCSTHFADVLEVDFLYAPGRNHIVSDDESEIQFAGPVTSRFAGWANRPELPVVAIFGLGMEYERSLGAFELLNPGIAYTFATVGTNRRITSQINKANEGLYPLVPEAQRFTFDVKKPLDCLNSLRSIVNGSLREGRPILVPLGPKIFALCSLLIAKEYFPDVGVWRFSSGRASIPRDIIETGEVSGLTVEVRI